MDFEETILIDYREKDGGWCEYYNDFVGNQIDGFNVDDSEDDTEITIKKSGNTIQREIPNSKKDVPF